MPVRSVGSSLRVRYEIPDLKFGTTIGFTSQEGLDLAEEVLFGRVSGARLPPNQHERAEDDADPAIWIDIVRADKAHAWVTFHGVIESPRYQVELQGFHWDFSKVINTLVMESAIGDGLLPVHAAALSSGGALGLFPGASGAGKSSISYAALSQDIPVLASELAFVRQGHLVCGNSALTIDAAAIDLFDLAPVPSDSKQDGSRLSFELTAPGSKTITRLIFPQVHPGDLQVRSITSRRARMLLFENVITQLPLGQLLLQETWPIWRPPGRHSIERIMDEIVPLSALEPVVVSGHPMQIAGAWARGAI